MCAFIAGFSRFTRQTKSYPHEIFYDFEAYLDKSERRKVTDALTFRHVPISVSVRDTLECEPTHMRTRSRRTDPKFRGRTGKERKKNKRSSPKRNQTGRHMLDCKKSNVQRSRNGVTKSQCSDLTNTT